MNNVLESDGDTMNPAAHAVSHLESLNSWTTVDKVLLRVLFRQAEFKFDPFI